MARHKSPLLIGVEYYPLRALWGLLRLLPFAWSEWLCLTLIRCLLFWFPKRKRIMESNLALCFPELTLQQRQTIGALSLQNLARGVAVFPRIPDLYKNNYKEWVHSEGFDRVEEALKKGHGAILFTAHYGLWEAFALHIGKYSNASTIARPLDNPRLDALITTVRSSTGTKVIPHRRALKEGLTTLRKNGVLGVVVDQNLYKGGIFVDFFGRLAATTTMVSLFARRTGCAVLPMYSVWDGRKIQLMMEPPMRLSDHPDPEQAVAQDTQRINTYVEKWIRQDPAPWLWIHNRWKRQPEAGDYVYSPNPTVKSAAHT